MQPKVTCTSIRIPQTCTQPVREKVDCNTGIRPRRDDKRWTLLIVRVTSEVHAWTSCDVDVNEFDAAPIITVCASGQLSLMAGTKSQEEDDDDCNNTCDLIAVRLNDVIRSALNIYVRAQKQCSSIQS